MRGINVDHVRHVSAFGARARLPGVEVSWLLEDNEMVIRTVKLWGGRLYKTYRIYEREIGEESAAS